MIFGKKRRFAVDEGGVAAIEFAILALPFFLIVFFLIEVAIGFLAQVTLENSAQRVSREVRIGHVRELDESELRARVCSNLANLFDCRELAVSLRSFETYRELANSVANPGRMDTVDPGAPEDIMWLTVGYPWPVVTPVLHRWIADTSDGTRWISAGTIFRNEPF